MGDVFLYLVLFAISIWTSRLAISKGRNPWAWGGAALLLSLIPWHLLGVVPVLVLLFMKSPATAIAAQPGRTSCPRCAKSYSGSQHFCTGCGWDLSAAYSPEDPEGTQTTPPQLQPQAQSPLPTAAVAEPVEIAEVRAPEIPTAATQTSEPETSDSTQESTVEAEQPASPDVSVAAVAGDGEQGPEAEHVPWGTHAIGEAPTAAVMTERGMARFAASKYQEAIDQFTKAIALDPNYAEAWQRRAEAYAQLGRSEQAAEDRRHLQGLDPSSSPG